MKSYKDKLDKFINLKKENNFVGHLSSILFHKNKIISENNDIIYKVWKSHQYSRIIYPIYIIEFNLNDEIVKLDTKTNIIGKILIGVFFVFSLLFLSYIFYNGIIIQRDIVSLVPFMAIFMLLFGFYKVFNRIYKNEKKYFIIELKINLGIITREEQFKLDYSKDEWTFVKVLTRAITYPFVIGILIASIWTTTMGYKKTIFAVPICLAYLFADIKILRRKNK